MAIKVTGTTVINDSRELENVTDMPNFIKKPSITSPTNNETDTDVALTIQGTPYNAVFDGSRDYREFQVDLDSGDFSSPVRTNQVDADSWVVDPSLDGTTSFKVRIRDVDLDGNVTDWSDEVSFTTALAPTTLGEASGGGFYMGTVAAAGTTYYLIVAPNGSGCACCQWKTICTCTPGVNNCFDGYENTYPTLANSTFPAANFTATRTIGGFSDWYLPAPDELNVIYNNGGGAGSGDPLPSGEDFGLNTHYWASVDGNTPYAFRFDFEAGRCYTGNDADGFYCFKTCFCNVRAVRRVPI